MKVIAIGDAPDTVNKTGWRHNGVYMDRAYYKGDIFEVSNSPISDTNGFFVIYHHKLETDMEVSLNNFVSLDEWREMKLRSLGI